MKSTKLRRLRWRGGYALLFAAVLAMLFVGQVEAAPIQWTSASGGNDHFYELISSPLTWQNANTAAAALSHLGLPGHLVTIASAAENAFLVTNGLASPNPWIGFNDFAVEGTFVWVTGEPVTYTNWGTGEPNDAGSSEDGVQIGSTGLWNDFFSVAPFDFTLAYIVEYEPVAAAIPEPSTLILLLVSILGVSGYGYFRRKKTA